MVSELFYNQWKKPHGRRRLRPVTQIAVTIGGERLDILGTVCVDVVIHGQRIMQEMLVVRYLKQPVILVCNFLMGNGAITYCTNGEITLQSIRVTIKLLKKSELVPNPAVVKCGSDVLIPARSEVGITAILERNPAEVEVEGYDGVIDPESINGNNDGILVARSVSSVHKGQTLVRVANVSVEQSC